MIEPVNMNMLAIAISIVLLPGLLASVICDKITVHSPRWDTFKYSIYSFLFGISSYTLLQALKVLYFLLANLLCFVPKLDSYKLDVWLIVQPSASSATMQVPLNEVLLATILAPIIACIASWIVNHKIINKIATKFRISQKYGDENLFSYFLNRRDVTWVYVLDKSDELTYMGVVESFSECDSIQEILLSDVSVYSYLESKLLYNLSLVYLSKPVGTFIIEVPKIDLEENGNG